MYKEEGLDFKKYPEKVSIKFSDYKATRNGTEQRQLQFSRKIKKSIQKIKIQDIGSYTNWTDLVVSRRI